MDSVWIIQIKTYMKHMALILLIVTVLDHQHAHSYETDKTAVVNFSTTNLSNSKKWRSLIHHDSGIALSGSSINNQDFFLSPQGMKDPNAELDATITALRQSPNMQCQYPARALWLKSVMPKMTFPAADCPEYDEFKRSINAESVSVLYASGHLGNPASMFGHVLLKFNNPRNHSLLDNTFSFGAIVPEPDTQATCIFQGLTGGYEGKFSNEQLHHQTLTYNESEQRDLWEYELTLPPTDIELLIAHLWEIRNATSTYYFLKQNCSYQLAKLLELVLEYPLLPENKPWVMPYDLVAKLNSTENVYAVTYRASRQEYFYHRFSHLTDVEKSVSHSIITQPANQSHSLLSTLNQTSSLKVIDTLYDYYAFLEAKNGQLLSEETERRNALLSARLALPVEQIKWEPISKKPPHTAQDTSLFQLSMISNAQFGMGYSMRIRPNYYDLLNVNSARIPHSELSAFDVTLLYLPSTNDLALREFTLFNLLHLNPHQTGLPGDSQLAWSLQAGYKPDNLDCINCSDPYLSGSLGKSWLPHRDLVLYSTIVGEVQLANLSKAKLGIGPEAGGVLEIGPLWTISLKAGHSFNPLNPSDRKYYAAWEQRFLNNRNIDFRTAVRYDTVFEYALNLNIYW